jgi:hypothetical protein
MNTKEATAARTAKTADVPALFPCLTCGKVVCIANLNICGPCFAEEMRKEAPSPTATALYIL